MSKPRVVVVNDRMTCIPNTKTLWHHLIEWFDAAWVGGEYPTLAAYAEGCVSGADPKYDVVIRNGTYFPWFTTGGCPVVSLIQDIHPRGHLRDWQRNVGLNSDAVVFNSQHTVDNYPELACKSEVIPLGVDFDLFRPSSCAKIYDVVWVGAGTVVKGWWLFQQIVRDNPRLRFACVTKDGSEFTAPNVTFHAHLSAADMAVVYNQSRMGLCTSDQETQHLPGIEMAACGLQVIAPPVGVYVNRPEWACVVPHDELSRTITDLTPYLGIGDPLMFRNFAIQDGLGLDRCKQSWIDLINKVTECNRTLR